MKSSNKCAEEVKNKDDYSSNDNSCGIMNTLLKDSKERIDDQSSNIKKRLEDD